MLGLAALGECGRDVGLFSPAPSMIKHYLSCKTRFEWAGHVASMFMEALSVSHSSLISPIGRVRQASHCSSSSAAARNNLRGGDLKTAEFLDDLGDPPRADTLHVHLHDGKCQGPLAADAMMSGPCSMTR